MMTRQKEPGIQKNPLLSAQSQGFPLPVQDSTALLILAVYLLFTLSVPKYDLAGVIAFAAFPVLIFTATRLPFLPLLKRLVMVSPFILFMAAGNLILDRGTIFRIYSFPVTGGMVSGTVIVAKTMVTLSTLLSLVSCMPFHRFGTALRALGVPEAFVTQLLLVYRYSFLLAEEAAMMQKARDLRSFGGKGRGLVVTAKLIGSLLIRTTSRAERIYMAMAARGFREGLGSKPHIPRSRRELVAMSCAFALFVIVRVVF